jgi:hypothetical protein
MRLFSMIETGKNCLSVPLNGRCVVTLLRMLGERRYFAHLTNRRDSIDGRYFLVECVLIVHPACPFKKCLSQERSWVFVAGGSRQSRRRRRREFDSRRYPTNFLIEFVQISGVHLIVPGAGVRESGPPPPRGQLRR